MMVSLTGDDGIIGCGGSAGLDSTSPVLGDRCMFAYSVLYTYSS